MKNVKYCLMTATLLLAGLAVFAGEDGKEPKKEEVKQETVKKEDAKPQTTPGGAGMVVSIDPSRGTLNSNPELSDEMKEALGRMVNTSSEGLVEQRLADGTVLVDLQGRFQSAMVATIGPDGKLSTNCFSKSPDHKHSESCNVVETKTGSKDKEHK